MIRLSQVKLALNEPLSALPEKIAKQLRIKVQDILDYKIYKESIDARKGTIKRVYTIDVSVKNEGRLLGKNKSLSVAPDLDYKPVASGQASMSGRPVVIGFGPAGMFAALLLAQAGYKPLVLERGEDVDKRTQSVDVFWKTGQLNPSSNVQFGEGGAGTFSDGKLTTRIKDLRCRKVLEELVLAGAPSEILYKNKPHIGTDKLKPTVKKIRKEIIRLGGEVRFSTCAENILIENECVSSITLNTGEHIESDAVVLAIGHSARDIFELLHEQGVAMQAKPFAVGVRIEHPQTMIDKVQYSSDKRPEGLGAAEYKLTHQLESGRGVYTFCMCPGGMVVASSSEEGGLVVNGMSEYARDQKNANSALLVSVTPEDFSSSDKDALAGVKFQRELERKAFAAAGKTYKAPVQRVDDFLEGRRNSQPVWGEVLPSYTPDVVGVSIDDIFPAFITKALKEAIVEMDKKLPGFARPDAVLTAVESRSSSPVRIHRNEETLESLNTAGLFPCGEGAGYAGGIMSSAVDGIKVAEQIIMKYKKPE